MTKLANHSAILALAVSHVTQEIKDIGYRPLFKQPTGSAHYGKANPQDFDVLVLVRGPAETGTFKADDGMPGSKPDDMEDFVQKLCAQGWTDCGEDGNTSGGNADAEDYRASWCALRAEWNGVDVNMIATTDIVWFYRQAAATALCRQLAEESEEFPDKETFVGVFRAVREGVNPWTGEKEE